MPLATGSRLGPYEILGAIGAGGMGEVYRARDSKLNRDVAIKVLAGGGGGRSPSVWRGSSARRRSWRRSIIRTSQRSTGREIRRRRGAGARACRGRNARGADRGRADPGGRGPRDRAADRGCPRGRARERDHAPGPEARQRQGDARRQGQGARLRAREGARSGHGSVGTRHDPLADDHGGGDAGGGDPWDGSVHVAGAGARKAGRQALRHLGVRLRAVGDAHGPGASSTARPYPTRWRRCCGQTSTGQPCLPERPRRSVGCSNAVSSGTRSDGCATSEKPA